MRTTHLFGATLVFVAATVGCNRSDTNADARRATAEVKAAAARTSHELADGWLTTKIQAQYFADKDVKGRNIGVHTRDGRVTLTGVVDSGNERDQAVQIAKSTDGVREVNDQLTLTGQNRETPAVPTTGNVPTPAPEMVTPAPTHEVAPVDDARVRARVQSRFFEDDRIKARRIDVGARQGVVTLSGEVASEDERARALTLARSAEGVQRVEDALVVKPEIAAGTSASGAPVDDATLVTTIQAKYFTDNAVKGSTIDVSARDGVVLLQGTVANAAAREQALAIAQQTPGVVQVVDRLMVGG